MLEIHHCLTTFASLLSVFSEGGAGYGGDACAKQKCAHDSGVCLDTNVLLIVW